MFNSVAAKATTKRTTRLLAITNVLLMMTACAATNQQANKVLANSVSPTGTPTKTVTGFSSSLRCMDDLMFRHGTRDVTLMMEELRDNTQKLAVGTRDMMISAVSEMTRRSRAVRLNAFGSDASNLSTLLERAQKTSPFAVIPEFDVRGSVTQLDEQISSRESGFGGLIAGVLGARFNNRVEFSALSFDTAVTRTSDFQVVPGVVSKNSVAISRRESSTADGSAILQRADVNFSFQVRKQDGLSQSLRNLVELASIELIGKLNRLPYWTCLGIDNNAPSVKRELEDWFLSMDQFERVAYFQQRLREQGFYDGPIDGQATVVFNDALRRMAFAIKPPVAAQVSQQFFNQLIVGPLPRAAHQSKAVVNLVSLKRSGAPELRYLGDEQSVKLALQDFDPNDQEQNVQISISAEQPGYVYCYAEHAKTGSLHRVFPNRFDNDPFIGPNHDLVLPGRGQFELKLGSKGTKRLSCLKTDREVYSVLPGKVRWGDFHALKVRNVQQIKALFEQVSGMPAVLTQLDLKKAASEQQPDEQPAEIIAEDDEQSAESLEDPEESLIIIPGAQNETRVR